MSDERAVQQVLARYVRAADARAGAAMAALFADDATVEIFYNDAGTPRKIAELVGAEAIGGAIAGMMTPHPPRGCSHHTTHDHIIEVDGDEATLDAQIVVFNTVGDEQPAAGWPAGARGAPGTITPIESGYYRPRMRRVEGGWQIVWHEILLDQPMAFPAPETPPHAGLSSARMTSQADPSIPTPLRDRLRGELTDALKARDVAARDALRSALGAIDNAEAIDLDRRAACGSTRLRTRGPAR